MKAITTDGVSAWAILFRPKHALNCTWRTKYRGPLAIHVGISRKPKVHDRTALAAMQIDVPEDIPTGHVLGIVDLVDVVEHDPTGHEQKIILPDSDPYGLDNDPLASGPICWILANPRCLPEAVAAKGKPRLWNCDVKDVKTCAFCDATQDLDMDHIPLRGIFPKPRPSNLITVPSCRRHNWGSSRDDTYFRDVLAAWDITSEHAKGRQVLTTVRKSFRRPEQDRYTLAFFRNVRQVERRTPSGLFIGKGLGFKPNFKRIDLIAQKIVRGLFYHEFSYRLPDTCSAFAGILSKQAIDTTTELGQIIEGCLKAFAVTPSTTIGEGVFRYSFHRFSDNRHASVWLLTFFERISFFAGTGPAEFMSDV